MSFSDFFGNIDGERLTPEFFEHLKFVVSESFTPVMYLGIDPGVHSGVTGYDERLHLQFMMNVHEEDITLFINCFDKLKKVIMEDFRLYSNKAQEQINSKMETTRVIGRIEAVCKIKNVPIVLQMPSVKTTGYRYIGKTRPTVKKKQNPMDAHVHFMYWAVTNKLLIPRIDTRTRKPYYILNFTEEESCPHD